MRTHVPDGHRDAPLGSDRGADTTSPALAASQDSARALAYELVIDCQVRDGTTVLEHARLVAEHADGRGWPDVRALAAYVLVLADIASFASRETCAGASAAPRPGDIASEPPEAWTTGHIDGFVHWARVSEDPLAIALSMIARARAARASDLGTNPLDDLISAYVASERVDARVERAFALHEIAGSLHAMRMWELAGEIYEIVNRLAAGLHKPRALIGALAANRFYTLTCELMHARESGRAAEVHKRAQRVADLPAIAHLGPAVPVEWHHQVAAYAAICNVLIDGGDGGPSGHRAVDTITGLLAAPTDMRFPQIHVLGALRCVLGWLHIQHGRWDDAEPLVLHGAEQILRGTDPAFRSFALWLRAIVSARAMRNGGALREYTSALLRTADLSRDALVKSTRARLQTERLRAERDRYAQESLTDSLTGLANRRALESRLRDRSPACTLIIVDIDRFKPVNDRYGHDVGDQVLRRIGHILRDCVRPGDMAARLGGDEFILVLDTADGDVATRRGHEVRDRISAAQWAEVHADLTVAASVGVASGNHGQTEDLYRAADEALYEAKRAGGACVRTAR
jgi:diguanylate cyclase (GGDEF)-like protein